MHNANKLMKAAYEQHIEETNSESGFLERFKAELANNKDNIDLIKVYDKNNKFFLLADGSFYSFVKDKPHISKANFSSIKNAKFEVYPSAEQQQIIYAALAGFNIKVQAFAGTGKTTTIKQLATVIDKPSLYVAFNKTIVDEVSTTIPLHVKAKTANGLAYSFVIAPYPALRNKFEGWKELWYHNNIKEFTGVTLNRVLLPIVIRTTKRFLKSIDKNILPHHISLKDEQTIAKLTEPPANKVINFLSNFCQKHRNSSNGDINNNINALYKAPSCSIEKLLPNYLTRIECYDLTIQAIKNAKYYSASDVITEEDFPSKLYSKIRDNNEDSVNDSKNSLVNKLLNASKTLWSNIIDPNCSCAIDHDAYLKIWQLSQPEINAEVIYIDEAQDLDPVMLDVLTSQKSQLIWLGDTYQQIYAWRGAINALEQIDDCLEYELTETYRFPVSLTKYANAALNVLGESRTIKSNKKLTNTRINKTAIITRTNNTMIGEALTLTQQGKFFAWSDNNFNAETLLKHCREIIKIQQCQAPFMDHYKEFNCLEDIEEFLAEESNDLISRPLSLCKRFNFNFSQIQYALCLIQKYINPEASFVLTTAHKSKGQEWDKVILTDDFIDAIERENKSGKSTKHEWNLLYVAMTRAKKELSLLDGIKLKLGLSHT